MRRSVVRHPGRIAISPSPVKSHSKDYHSPDLPGKKRLASQHDSRLREIVLSGTTHNIAAPEGMSDLMKGYMSFNSVAQRIGSNFVS